ncbi:mCG1031049, isoform CRA_a, partial [Mus musculus]
SEKIGFLAKQVYLDSGKGGEQRATRLNGKNAQASHCLPLTFQNFIKTVMSYMYTWRRTMQNTIQRHEH